MRFVTINTLQLLILTLAMAAVTSVLVSINTWYLDTRLLPEVHQDDAGQCVKVVNFENGHAFNCNDVNVILRRYRTVTLK